MVNEDYKDLFEEQKKRAENNLQNLGFSEKEKTIKFSSSVSKKQIGANITVKVGK